MRITQFHEPKTLNEALELLSKSDDHTALLAGGTDLVVRKNAGINNADTFIAIRHLEELKGITKEGNNVVIGAATLHEDVAYNDLVKKEFPAFADAIRRVGTKQIRNLGTLGGNICNASPVADSVCPLITLDATLRLESVRGKREVAIGEFFTGPGKTVKEADEILTQIVIPMVGKNVRQGFKKLGPRKEADIAIVNMAAAITVDGDQITDAKIAFGSVGPTAMRSPNSEKVLIGKKLSEIDYDALGKAAAGDVTPIADQRASLEYRRDMSETLIKDLVAEILK